MAARAPAGEPRGNPTRRAVLRAGLAAGAVAATGALGGCRLRLEDDAPSVPLLSRRSIPDERLLVDQYRDVRALAVLAAAVPPSPLLSGLAAAYERQAAVLRAVLVEGGVPTSAVEPAPGTTLAPAPSSPGAGGGNPSAALGTAQASAVSSDALERLAGAGPRRPLLTAITAHRASGATLLGATVAWPPGRSLPPPAARRALEVARQAVYATEVAAARVPPAARGPFLALLPVLERRVSGLSVSAGDPSGDTAALGYRLPFAVTTAQEAARLVGTALDGLVDHGLDALPDLPAGSPAIAEVVRLQTQAAVLRVQWGAPLPPFPGLVDA